MEPSDFGPLSAATCRQCGQPVSVRGLSPEQAQQVLLEHALGHSSGPSVQVPNLESSLADIFDQPTANDTDLSGGSRHEVRTQEVTGSDSLAGQATSEGTTVEPDRGESLFPEEITREYSTEASPGTGSPLGSLFPAGTDSGQDSQGSGFPTGLLPSGGDSRGGISGMNAGSPSDMIKSGAEDLVKKGISSKTGAATGGAEKNVVKGVTDIAKTVADKDLTADEKVDQAAFTIGKEGSKAAAKAGLAYAGLGAAAEPLVENPLTDKVADQFGKNMQRNAKAVKQGSKFNPIAMAGKKAVKSAPGKKAASGIKKSVGKNAKRAGVALKPFKFAARLSRQGKSMLVIGLVLLVGFSASLLTLGTVSTLNSGPQQDSYLWAVEVDLAQTDIPLPYIEAYTRAGRSRNVPWTLLAAVGAQASAHGRVDPYKQAVPPPSFGSTTIPLDVQAGLQAPSNSVLVLSVASDGDGFVDSVRKQFDGTGLSVNVLSSKAATVDWALSQVKDMDLAQGSKVVVNLGQVEASGSSSPSFRDSAVRLATKLSGQDVTWLTVDISGKGGDSVNRVLTDDVQAFPNVKLANWAVASTDSYRAAPAKDVPGSSPVSTVLNAQGVQAKAEFIAAAATGELSSTVLGQPAGGGLTGPGVLPEPTGTCPAVDPAIAGKKLDRGFGPLMLKPTALGATSLDQTAELQDICSAAGILASAMAGEAVSVASSMGLTYPGSFRDLVPAAQGGDAQAAQLIQTFWTKVMGNLTILGTTEKTECRTEPRPEDLPWPDYVSGSISSVWGCVLEGEQLQTVYRVDSQDGVVSFETLTQSEARRRAVSEALEVAWAFSRWGEKFEPAGSSSDGATTPKSECDPSQPLVGVFPLTAAKFQQYLPEHLEGRTRCDMEASITAAAFAFAAGESVPPASRRGGPGGYLAMYGGWFEFAANVVGPKAAQDAFAKNGPYRPVSVPDQCIDALAGLTNPMGGDEKNPLLGVPAPVLRAYVSGKGRLPATIPAQIDSYLNSVQLIAGSGENCAGVAPGSPEFWTAVYRSIGKSDGPDPDLPPPSGSDASAAPSPTPDPAQSASPGAAPTPSASPAPSVSTSAATQAATSPSAAPSTPASSGVATPALMAKALSKYARSKIQPVVPAVPAIGRTAILQRFSHVPLKSLSMPAVRPWAPVTERGTNLNGIAMSVYGGLYPAGPMIAGGVFTGANCPQVVPGNTLRDGSEAIGAYALCTQAVAQAATPQAALAIQWAFNHLGIPYAPWGSPRDGPNSYDCSSFVSHAYYDSSGIGIAGETWSHSTREQMPWDYVRVLDPHYQVVPAGQERPGDLVMQRTSSTNSQHVLMYLGVANGVQWVAHTNMEGDVSKVEDMPTTGIDSGSFRRVVPTSAEEQAKIDAAAAVLGGSALGPLGPLPPAGKGGEWLLQFLHAKGMRGTLLRTVWAIGMRESNGNPTLTTSNKEWNWISSGSPHYDVGVFQVNNVNLSTVRQVLGPSATMRDMMDPNKNFAVSQTMSKNWTNFLPWGLTPQGTFDWSYYDSGWLSRYQANSEYHFRSYFAQFPQVARAAGISTN